MTERERFTEDNKVTFTPFWRRFPYFFLLPLQLGSMIRITGYSLLGSIATLFPYALHLALEFLYVAFFLQYGLQTMSRNSRGYFDEPDGIDDRDAGDWSQILRLFAFIALLLLMYLLLGDKYGESGGQLAMILINLLLPAGIMIIVIEGSFFQALHPSQYKHLIGAIGAPYLSLCFILLSMTEVEYWWGNFLMKHLPFWLKYPLGNFIEFYFILVACHMIGYVIYQYHDVLGLRAAISFDRAETRLDPKKEVNPLQMELNRLVADGQYGRVIDLLEIELRKNWDNNDTHDRYQKALFAAGLQTKAKDHARDFISKLINEKRFFMAIDLCEKWLKFDPAFKLNDSHQLYDLAAAAHLVKRDAFALELMRNFDKKYPEHPHIPQLYLLTAQILGEISDKNQEAMDLLQTLITAYPDHPLASEARQLLLMLGKRTAIS